MRKCKKITYKQLGHEGYSHYEGEEAVGPAYTYGDITKATCDELTISMFGVELDEDAVVEIRDNLNAYLQDVSNFRQNKLKRRGLD
jgi:hypothetical protein